MFKVLEVNCPFVWLVVSYLRLSAELDLWATVREYLQKRHPPSWASALATVQEPESEGNKQVIQSPTGESSKQ
jgi:hypothetical protein